MASEPATETTAEQPAKAPAKTKRQLPWKRILLVLVVAGLAFAGGYLWRDHTAKQQQKKQDTTITGLKKDVADLKKAAKTAAKTTPKTVAVVPATTKPSAATIENIKASITSGNTAALEGYMAPTVHVVIAASEGVGDRTPTQAVSDLSYLNNATDPWNFDLPAATLTSWRAGSYASYFPTDAVVGKSANDYVISFTFNSSGKISGVFMAVNSDLLT
jgi:hypothetical protein